MLVLPEAFPVTGVGICAVLFVNIFQVYTVSKERRASGVKYPNLYASDAEAAADPKKFKFNCAQRAHANTLEHVPFILSLAGYLSLWHPKVATGAVVTWALGRLFYTINYASGSPARRNGGLARLGLLGEIPLILGAIYVTAIEAPQYLKI